MKNLFVFSAFMAIFILLSGCSQGEDTSKEKVSLETENFGEEIVEEKGVYVGQADPHTIEIELPEGPKSFQLSEEQKLIFANLPEGKKVKIQYFKNQNDQLIIKKLEVTEELIEEEGIYVGQIDPHTVEIETANGNIAYQLNEVTMNEVTKLHENDQVTFQYVKNEYGQLVIMSIH